VQLACWHGRACNPFIPILTVSLLSLNMCIHRFGYGVIR
jgi:hypothetical protein